MHSLDIDKLKKKHVCSGCVGESYLKTYINNVGRAALCSYCDHEGPTIKLKKLAKLTDKAFEDHFDRTSNEPDGWEYSMLKDPDIPYEWEREGEEAQWTIAETAEVDEDIAEDVRLILEKKYADPDMDAMGEECPFSEESHYVHRELDDGNFSSKWDNFVTELKTKSRFFSPSVHLVLDQIFGKLKELQTSNGNSVIVTAGPDSNITKLYRARVFANEPEKLEEALKFPWKHLGSPPAKSASAGRMNAHGISVFYGATENETAITEVRPPVGSKVAVATFKICRPLQLLDLNLLKSLNTTGSIFDPNQIHKMEKANFLGILTHLLSRVVMPHEEAIENLPTQAVAEYMANELKLDGILYPSVQQGDSAINVVLFHHASRVAEHNLPKGTKVTAHLTTQDSDGVKPDYWVWEEVPAIPTDKQDKDPLDLFGSLIDLDYTDHTDVRENTLSIHLDNIKIHHIQGIKLRYESHPTERHHIQAS